MADDGYLRKDTCILHIPSEQVAQFSLVFEGNAATKDIQDELDEAIEHLVALWPDGKIIVDIRVEHLKEGYQKG